MGKFFGVSDASVHVYFATVVTMLPDAHHGSQCETQEERAYRFSVEIPRRVTRTAALDMRLDLFLHNIERVSILFKIATRVTSRYICRVALMRSHNL